MPRVHNTEGNSHCDYVITSVRNDRTGKKPVDDLCKTKNMKDQINHMFDHGHMGYYPYAKAINRTDSYVVVYIDPSVKRRGIFNVENAIRERIWSKFLEIPPDAILKGTSFSPGYDGIDSGDTTLTLQGVAHNLVKTLFSSDTFDGLSFGPVQENQGWGRFTIDAMYKGGDIQGIDNASGHKFLGLKMQPFSDADASNGTNEVRIVVEVREGRIRIVSIFPLG